MIPVPVAPDSLSRYQAVAMESKNENTNNKTRNGTK